MKKKRSVSRVLPIARQTSALECPSSLSASLVLVVAARHDFHKLWKRTKRGGR